MQRKSRKHNSPDLGKFLKKKISLNWKLATMFLSQSLLVVLVKAYQGKYGVSTKTWVIKYQTYTSKSIKNNYNHLINVNLDSKMYINYLFKSHNIT